MCFVRQRQNIADNSIVPLPWRHNKRDGVSNHRRLDYLLNHLFGHRSKKTSKPRVNGLCEGNSPVTSKFPAERANNDENVPIWWRHHVMMAAEASYFILLTSYTYNFGIQIFPWIPRIHSPKSCSEKMFAMGATNVACSTVWVLPKSFSEGWKFFSRNLMSLSVNILWNTIFQIKGVHIHINYTLHIFQMLQICPSPLFPAFPAMNIAYVCDTLKLNRR